MAQTLRQPIVVGRQKLQIYYEERKWLCFKYQIRIKTESFGNSVILKDGDEPITDVFLNGKQIYKSN